MIALTRIRRLFESPRPRTRRPAPARHRPSLEALEDRVVLNAPTITRSLAAVTVNEGSPAANSGTFNDPQGRATVTLTASVGTLTRNDAAGTWAWSHTPPDNNFGPTTVTITATDNTNLRASTTFTLTVNNVAPTITAVSVPAGGNEGSPVNLSATATDPAGANDPLTYTWTVRRPDNSTFTVSGGSTSFTPPENGTFDVSLAVSDGDGGTATRTAAPAGIVSSWKGDLDARDVRGANHGTWVGTPGQYLTGVVGSGFFFRGFPNSDAVQVADAPSLDLTGAVTLEAWVNSYGQDGQQDLYGAIIAKSTGGNIRNYGLYRGRDGSLTLSYFTTGGVNVVLNTAPNVLPIVEWHHVAAVIHPAGNRMQIYRDGQLVASRATAGPLLANSAPLTIGMSDGQFRFHGGIDEPSVYNRALSQAEIQFIARAGGAGKPPPVAVANVAPAITALTVPSAGAPGQPVALSAAANDPAGANDPLTYTWTVTRPNLSTFTLPGPSVSFTPADRGRYGVSLTVRDDDGGITSAPAANLVGWWKGEGNTNDVRGNHHGTPEGGVTYVPGRVGQAFSFDGSGRVAVADAPGLDLTSAVTMEAWINPSTLAFPGGYGTILDKDGGTGQYWTRNYGLQLKSDGRLHLSYKYGTWGNCILETPANLVPVGQFSHVAGVINWGGGAMQIYRNGQLVASRAPCGSVRENSMRLTIGHSSPLSNFGFRGLIDEPAVYGRALSQGEIQSIVNFGGAGKPASVLVTQPQTMTWTGAGADGNWTTGANWQGGAAPLDGDDLVFPAGAGRPANSNTFDAGTPFRSLTLGGAGYTLGGNPLTLTGGLNAAAGGASTVALNLTLGATQSVTTVAGAQLTLSGAVSGGGVLSKAGAGQLTVAGELSATGFTLTAGTVLLAATGGLFTVLDYLQQGGTLAFAGGYLALGGIADFRSGQVSGDALIIGDVVNSGATIHIGGSGRAGYFVATGNFTNAAGGVVNMELAGPAAVSQYDVMVVGGNTSLAGTLNVSRLGGYVPVPEDFFLALYSVGPLTGQYTTVTGLVVSPQRTLVPTYDSNFLWLF